MFKLVLFGSLIGACVFGLFKVVDTAFQNKEEATEAEKLLKEKTQEIKDKDNTIHKLERKIASLKEAYDLKKLEL